MMIFIDPNNPEQVASRNAADITLSGISSSKVTINVYVGDPLKASFQAEPYGGNLTIRLSDILRSLGLFPFGGLPNMANTENWESLKTVFITADATGEYSPLPWVREAFEGGYDPSMHEALANSYWWTWRDQVCRTFRSGKELLGAMFLSESVSIKIVATFADGTTGSMLKAVPGASGDVFLVFDVSYSYIAGMFQKEVVSYKVYRGNSVYPQVYEVSRLNPRRTFLFRNSLGLFDTVYALGRISDGESRDVKTFISSDRSENISENNSRERIYVNSGPIDTKGERTLWGELFQSEQVWEYESERYRRIVIDNFDMELPEGVSGVATFEYHYSELPGGGYVKSEL